MRTIGIRAEPSAVTFVIYDTVANEILNIERIKIPKALNIPESLKYVRINIIDVLRGYDVEKAGIRVTESSAQSMNEARIQLEAIILETFATYPLRGYFCGQIATISKLLNFDRSSFKKFISGELNFDALENWNSLSNVEKEACFAALGAANA